MFGRTPKPKSPLGSDMTKIVLMLLLFIGCIFIKAYKAAFLFLLIAAYWGWHFNHIRKKIDKALEKREQNFAEIYGYEDGYGNTSGGYGATPEENTDEYF